MSVYDTHVPESGGGGLYLKLKDGDRVELRIASDPVIFQSVGKDSETGEPQLRTRYAWLVWNKTAHTAQIFENSATFFKNLAGLAQDKAWGDPKGYDITVTRHGTQLDTTYTVIPVPNTQPLGIDAGKLIQEIDIIEKLRASQYTQNVMWLADFDAQAKRPTVNPRPADEAPQPSQPPQNVAIEDFGDEPINLDDIPF